LSVENASDIIISVSNGNSCSNNDDNKVEMYFSSFLEGKMLSVRVTFPRFKLDLLLTTFTFLLAGLILLGDLEFKGLCDLILIRFYYLNF
jgi:hypothetical protein